MLCLDVLSLSDHGDLGAVDAQRQERFFVRAVSLGGEGGVVGRFGDTRLVDIDGGNVVAKLMADARNAAAKSAEADNGNTFA